MQNVLEKDAIQRQVKFKETQRHPLKNLAFVNTKDFQTILCSIR